MPVPGLVAAATEALLPSLCLSCDSILPGGARGLCPSCWTLLTPLGGERCSRCAGATDPVGDPCLTCSHEPPPQEGTVAWGEYDGVLRTAVLALKHGGRDELATPLARRLAARVSLEPWAAQLKQVTFVPSHLVYTLRRGLSAAHLLAIGVARALELPLVCLLRRRGLGRQARRSRPQRLQLPVRSFSPRPKLSKAKYQQPTLVVDDVSTTGTTLRRAAAALLVAGASSVYAAALALAPDARRFP